jgi:DNA replication protein DnaC
MAKTSQVPTQLRKALTRAIQGGKFPLYIHGTPGTGKTCLMGLVYSTWIGRAAWFQCSRLLLDLARCRSNPDHQCQRLGNDGNLELDSEWQAWQDIRMADLLCLDDVGVKDLTDAQVDVFKEIIDIRTGRPTILTSNLSENELASVMDIRLASRLVGGTILTIIGEDKRQAAATVLEVRV